MRLLILPGLGDNYMSYHLALPWWLMRRFRPTVYMFDWEKPGEKFEERLAVLRRFVEYSGSTKWAVLGCSAGGVLAASLLATLPTHILRVAAVAAPLGSTTHGHALLADALSQLRRTWPAAATETRDKLMAYFSENDLSCPYSIATCIGSRGVRFRRVVGNTHASTIAHALTVDSAPIALWLRDGVL